MNQQLLEPLKFYRQSGRALHDENIRKHFDGLHARSGVNAEENRATVKLYRAECAKIEKLNIKQTRLKVLRVFLIIAAVLGGVLAVASIWQFEASVLYGTLMLAGGLLAAAGAVVLICLKINPTIKHTNTLLEKHSALANRHLATAQAQMAPLNALFDSTDTLRLIEQTLPDITFSDHFTKEQELLFRKQHDFLDYNSDTTSITNTLSGSFAGNPFLFCRRLIQTMGTKTYHGSIVITWTERYRDSKGNFRTRLRTQTLHASLTKPCPVYSSDTYLCYGSQAAPDLSFSRAPQHSERLDEKKIDRKVRRGAKKLKEKAEDAVEQGGSFQEMANAEFDVLFGATDRDHEVQFRLMYTPLAQTNTVDLLTSTDGYGDDFHFTKRRRFNMLKSEHAQHWDMNTSAARYYSYDFDTAKQSFISFNQSYFKSLFFDFAPLLSVPAYLEHPCSSLDTGEHYESNYACYEHEVMANAIGARGFAPFNARTQSILKTRLLQKQKGHDRVAVTAHAFTTVSRVDVVPRLGGDGRMHGVPVRWDEYIPVEKTTTMIVSPAPYSENQLRDARERGDSLPEGTFFHGLVARAYPE